MQNGHRTVQPAGHQDHVSARAGDPGRRRLVVAAVLAAVCATARFSVRADTVFLKDGTSITDCKVTSETADGVSLRTFVGEMRVPRADVHRIVKQRSVYDTYEEQVSRIREGDAKGLFKLAQWARNANGLRKESDDLLARVIAVDTGHAGARRLLGHVRAGSTWQVPPPLAFRLRVGGASGKDATDLEDRVGLFLKSRPDLRVTSESAGDSLNACTLDVSVSIGQKAGTQFYGVSIGRPTIGATVTLRAASPWIGKTPLKVGVSGEVPAGGINAGRLAIQNALGMNSRSMHQFLDQLVQLRVKALEKDLAKSAKEARPA